jgi:hypothetical protein
MAKIFNPPSEIKIPELSLLGVDSVKTYNETCDNFKKDLKDWCIKRAKIIGTDTEYIGEVIYFPVADSNAEYMVASLKPVELIHIPLWDAWELQYANRLTKKDIIEKIEQQNSLKKLFGSLKK